jgi:hypothetical protein
MLHGVARWLRAAGHDTALAEGGADDRALLRRAATEQRRLLTRDRRLAARADAGADVFVPEAESLDAVALELRERLALDWLAAPFTRCLVDNTRLAPAEPEDALRVPAASRPLAAQLHRCPACGRLYWPGSHFRRMRARLEAWAGGRCAPADDAPR